MYYGGNFGRLRDPLKSEFLQNNRDFFDTFQIQSDGKLISVSVSKNTAKSVYTVIINFIGQLSMKYDILND